MTELEMPDGTIIEFPDGTPPDVMKAAAAKFMGKAPAAPRQDFRGDSKGSALGAAGRMGVHGLMLGFSDELGAGASAVGDVLLRGAPSFGESYNHRLANERGQIAQMREENPIASTAGEIAGAAALPIGAGTSIARGAVTGGLAGATYGFGEGDGGAVPRLQSASVGGAVGGAAGAAAPFVLGAAQRAVNNRATRRAVTEAADAAPTPASLARQSGALYKEARRSGVVVAGDAMRPLLDDLAGMERLDADFTPDALKVIGRLKEKLEAGDLPLAELEKLHSAAGLAITKNRITNPADAGAAGQIAQRVDEFMMSLPDEAIVSNVVGKGEAIETFRQARALWKQFRKSEKLQEIVANAELKDNPAAAIKQGFRAILTNKNKRATYSAAEIQVMRQVISDTKAGNWVQRLIGYGTGLSRQVAATTAGYGMGGPIGAAVGSAVATKIGSIAKDAASDAALTAGDRAARFVADGGRFVQPAPRMLPMTQNALKAMSLGVIPPGFNALTSREAPR